MEKKLLVITACDKNVFEWIETIHIIHQETPLFLDARIFHTVSVLGSFSEEMMKHTKTQKHPLPVLSFIINKPRVTFLRNDH